MKLWCGIGCSTVRCGGFAENNITTVTISV